MGKLDGKVAVITGCAGGLGKDYAIRFAEEGANLAICSRTASKLMETKQLCEEAGAQVVALPCDVGVYDDLVEFVDKTVERFGTIDILVNNAITNLEPAPFIETSLEHLDIQMHTGFYATWHMMKLCFPYMKDKPSSIINISSQAGVEGMAGRSSYAAVKEAIRGLSRVAAREWGKHQIRVNVVCPIALAASHEERMKAMSQEWQESVRKLMRDNPLGRVGDGYSDVAPAIVFLASDDSRWITGQTLHVEGGNTIFA